MSTIPPPIPPGPPGQPYQQPYPPYPPKPKTSPIVWILLGVGIFIMMAILVVAGIGFFFVHKVKQAGFDSDLMKRNPAYATVKMMAALNPNIEVVSMDDQKGVVVVREKSTGKTYTVNFEDAKRGKFVFAEQGKKPVTITTNGDNPNGSVEMKSEDGTVKIGGAVAGAKLPAWVPDYPGSTPQGTFSAQSNEGTAGMFQYRIGDPVDKLAKFYEDGFKSMGMKTTSTISNADGKTAGGMVSGEAGGKSAVVILSPDGGQTAVNITFKSK